MAGQAFDVDLEQAGFDAGALAVEMAGLSTEEQDALQQALADQAVEAKAQRDATLNAVATSLCKLRQEAISGRSTSGIELDWEEDEEAYDGIDDANRAEEGATRTRKPLAGGGSTAQPAGAEGGRKSTVFLNVTAPYVDSGAARIGDMLLPNDDRGWSFRNTPIADAAGDNASKLPLAISMQQPPPQPSELTPEQLEREEANQDSARRAENAQKRVDDWLIECNFHAQARQTLDDSARIGTGILKGPFPVARERTVWRNGQLVRSTEIVPASRRIDYWDAFPDAACGENVHNGSYFFERDRLTRKKVGDLRAEPGYFLDQLEEVLREGPCKHTTEGRVDLPQDSIVTDKQFEIWYCHATLEREDLEVMGCDCPDDETVMVPVQATIINDRVVKIIPNPLDKGSFPYDFMSWQRRKGMPWGRGIARRLRSPQRIVNGATRNLMDNAGLAAGLILLLKRKGLTPADGNWNLHGRKIFFSDDDDLKKAEDAIHAVEIPMRTEQLLATVEFGLAMAEKVTGMPLLLQGQDSRSTPDTLGGQQLATNNANGALRRIAKLWDDSVMEPHVTRYYDYLQAHGENEDEKGDFIIDARGSSTLVEREIANNEIAQLGAVVKDPAYEINPAKWVVEYMKSRRLDPKKFQYTEEEKKALREQQQPVPYQITVAETRAKADLERQQMADGAAREREIIKLLGEEELSAKEIKTRLFEIVTADRTKRDLFAAESALKTTEGSGI